MKEKFTNAIVLGGLAGLMFCIVPIGGFEFRLSWQLAAIWGGGLFFAAFLSGWWRRLFWLAALGHVAFSLPPSYDAYVSLGTVAVFLAFVEKIKGTEIDNSIEAILSGMSKDIDEDRVLNAIAVGALALIAWQALQFAGAFSMWFERPSGPFNPCSAGAMLALCLPAFMRRRWWPGFIACAWGICAAGSSTGAAAGMAATIAFAIADRRIPRIALLSAAGILGSAAVLWVSFVDPLANTLACTRWVAWQRAAEIVLANPLGLGLGSFKDLFPQITAGVPGLGELSVENGAIVMRQAFTQAHNEYVQLGFELGLPTLALACAWVLSIGIRTLISATSPRAAAGMTAIAVGCLGWGLFHIAPLALVACAWIGLYEKSILSAPEPRGYQYPRRAIKTLLGKIRGLSGQN